MKRLLIIASQSMIANAIRLALRQTTGFEFIGSIDGRQPAARALAELRPDVVLVDDMSERGAAFARMREVSEAAPLAPCIFIAERMDEDWLEQAFGAGASAVVSKSVHAVAMGTLLREISEGTVVHRPSPGARNADTGDALLTARELQILQLTAQGLTNGRIASTLWVTEQTVKFHLSNTYRKLGVTNRTQASHYAHTRGLLNLDDATRAARGSRANAVAA